MKKYLEKLEYHEILNILASYTNTSIGYEKALFLLPYQDSSLVKHYLQETTEAITLYYRKSAPPLYAIPVLTEHLKILNSNGSLSMKQLLEIANVLKLARELKLYFFSEEKNIQEFFILNDFFARLYANLDIESKIFSSILDENTMDDNASIELKNIRKSKIKIMDDIKRKLNSFLHSSNYSKYLQDAIITVKNDRYVIPVKQEYKSEVKGFIHDISSTGATVFIEPISIFELNNTLNELTLSEGIEISKILQRLSALFMNITDNLECNCNLIGTIDFAFAKAKYAISTNSSFPEINDRKEIHLAKARHPLIPENAVVPIDIYIGDTFTSLIITGPNTGGKTVALKTVGLLTLMGMSGLYIPANEHSSIYVFDSVFADIGDEQSISQSLSTFSSHMKNIIEIVDQSSANSLVLLDELGSGTDPMEGASLGISILQYLHEKNVLTIATTHYTEIKNFALVTEGFKNASSEFNIETLSPTYKIIIGIPGKSMAFDISKKLGLNEEILSSAKKNMDHSHVSVEELLKSIYDDKLMIETEKEKILKQSQEIENLKLSLEHNSTQLKEEEATFISNAKQEARNILIQAKQEADAIIKELTNSNNKEANALRRKLNNKIENLSTLDSENRDEKSVLKSTNIFIGADLYSNRLNHNVTILTLPNKSNEVQIQFGNMKMVLPINDLSESIKSNKKDDINVSKRKTPFKIISVSSEINVIGKNVEEANIEIDKYLDTAFLNGLSQITIVHGKGTGALRTGVHNFLKNHKHVKSYRLGTFGEGEMGVTIVELK